MNSIKIIIFSILLLFFGILFFFYQESWIIISIPNKNPTTYKNKSSIHPKETPLWIFTHETFQKETTEIIFSNDQAQTIKQLLNNWLTVLEEENVSDKQISVQSVILSKLGQEAFICFSESFLNKQTSLHTKFMIIESMLKTLKEAKLNITNVKFLVHHQSMQDAHLNFDISWPITGFQF